MTASRKLQLVHNTDIIRDPWKGPTKTYCRVFLTLPMQQQDNCKNQIVKTGYFQSKVHFAIATNILRGSVIFKVNFVLPNMTLSGNLYLFFDY